MHVLITGPRGVGKSTLVRRLTAELGMPLFGFETKKEAAGDDSLPGDPIYIREAGAARQSGGELLGYCRERCVSVDTAAFDRFASRLCRPVPPGHLVVMDELGVMESGAEEFCAAVLALLDGDAPVLAVVKDKHPPFLDAVRAHPKCRAFYVTEDNRDALFDEILALLRK